MSWEKSILDRNAHKTMHNTNLGADHEISKGDNDDHMISTSSESQDEKAMRELKISSKDGDHLRP